MMIGTASIGRAGLSTAPQAVFLAFQLEPSALGRLASYGRKCRMMVYVGEYRTARSAPRFGDRTGRHDAVPPHHCLSVTALKHDESGLQLSIVSVCIRSWH